MAEPGFRTKQAVVALFMALATLVSLAAVALPMRVPALQLEVTGLDDRLQYWAAAGTLIILPLILSIARIANHRFFSPSDIDGSGLTAGDGKVKALRAVLQNTIEQTVLALVVYLIWVIAMPAASVSVIFFAATCFLVGRLLFWLGYQRGAGGRAFGFALTMYPSAIMLAILILNSSLLSIATKLFGHQT